MVLSAERKCLLWLSSGEIPAHQALALMERYGGAQGVWDYFGQADGPRFQPQAEKRLRALHSREAMDDACENLLKRNVRLLFRDDPEYPAQLAAIDDPPYLLYYAGRLACLSHPCVAVVGTRSPSAYGREMARMIARGLCEAGVCVVSGLALGVDEAAHQGALEAEGRTVGVLGSGINNPYPSEHRALLRKIAGGTGLILSEYPLNAQPVPYHFPHRNRVIAGLSLATVLVEGRVKSGGMSTVTAALNQGREVFAVPGRVGTLYAEGPHTLLREGAHLATCARDVLDDLGLGTRPEKRGRAAPPQALTGAQTAIVGALRAEPLTIDELAAKLRMDAGAVMEEIGTLEILGSVAREAGNRFALPIHGESHRR